jgi:hydroxymethylpyrimidine pyrophosphatase-like HAD family hydrolase
MIVSPELAMIERHVIGVAVAARCLDIFARFNVGAWAYTADRWVALTRDLSRTAHEAHTIGASPTIVPEFEPYLADIGKLTAVSDDAERLSACEAAVRETAGNEAVIARSQRYYLDVTPHGMDKGTFVAAMAGRLGIPIASIVTIGDMSNDLPMFRAGGWAIAMGNADASVKQAAQATTRSNDEDGFAFAMDALLATAPPKTAA